MAQLVKNLPANAEDARYLGSILGPGRSPGEGNNNPLLYSCLGNPMDRGAWQGPSDCEELDMTEHACILSLAQECYCPSHAQVGLLWLMNVSNRDAEAGAV